MLARRQRTGRVLVLCVGLLAGAALSACSSPARALPAGATVLNVAPVRQQDTHACGLATVEALTAYHDVSLDAQTREQIAARTSAQEGLTGADLRSVLEQAGLEVYLFRGTLDHAATGLWRALDDGWPLLIAIASAPGRNHYVLLVGYDPPTGDVAVLDPAQGSLVIPAERFVACWTGAERFTLLAVPRAAAPDAVPVPSRLSSRFASLDTPESTP